jgi:hypothetical protein
MIAGVDRHLPGGGPHFGSQAVKSHKKEIQMLNAYETSGTSPTSKRKINFNSWGRTTDSALQIVRSNTKRQYPKKQQFCGNRLISSRRKRWNDGACAELNFEVNQ